MNAATRFMGWHKTRHKTNGLTPKMLAKMADFCDIKRMTMEAGNELANRWFQPLTHVSEAGSPRESGIVRQQPMRENRDEQRSLVAQKGAQYDPAVFRPRRRLWVDGVNSAVMAHFVLMDDPDAEPVHCDLGDSVHEDSRRFIDDLEQWYGKPIERIRSTEFANIDEVFEKRRYLSGPKGAPCTGAMKFVPRLNSQLPSDIHHWGYAADKADAKRFAAMCADYPELHQRAPLIEMGLKKTDTHAILKQHGIRRPWVYEIGMPNGNCLCCVKSSSPRYWAHQRKWFPEVFARRADQARRFGARLVILRQEKGLDGKRHNIRCYPDELPIDTPTEIRGNFGGCGFSSTCGTVTKAELAADADALVEFALQQEQAERLNDPQQHRAGVR